MNDNGSYTKFPNNLFDWLLATSTKLNKREIIVLLAVIRNTAGYHRQRHPMSCRFIAEATGLDPAHISRAIKLLEEEKMIIVDRSGRTPVIGINPDVVVNSAMAAVAELATPPPDDCCRISNRSVAESATEVLPNQQQDSCQIGNKERKEKENINKIIKKPQTGSWLDETEGDVSFLVH